MRRDILFEYFTVLVVAPIVLFSVGWGLLKLLVLPVSPDPLTLVSVVRDGPPGTDGLRVKFRTDTNLERLSDENKSGSVLFAKFQFCSAKAPISESEISQSGIDTNAGAAAHMPQWEAMRAHMYDRGPFEYEAELVYVGGCGRYSDGCRFESGEELKYCSYCAEHKAREEPPPDDICMTVYTTGCSMGCGRTIESNAVRIPKDMIAKALAAP